MAENNVDLPSSLDYEEKIVQFKRFIIKHQRSHSYPLRLMANRDESLIDVGLNKPFKDSEANVDGMHG